MLSRIVLLVFSATLLGCVGTRTAVAPDDRAAALTLRQSGPTFFRDWGHSPLRALDGVAVRFRASVTSDAGIRRAELHVYEYELYRGPTGTPLKRRRVGGLWGRLADWSHPGVPSTLELEHTYVPGFGPHTRLEYVWRVVDANGETTDRLGVTDAGTSPWPQDKVLLFAASRAPMADLIDIAFFRDVDYGPRVDIYREDVEAMVTEGFLGDDAFGRDRTRWAFYTTDRVADGRALSEDITNEALVPAFLKDFSVPGIDAFCLLHREEYTDRSLMTENFHSLSSNLFSAEAHNWGTAIHECGHAIFHLSDEYEGCACFQSHAGSNVFRERKDCVAWNLSQGFPAADCYPVADLYDRAWWSAEEPTFFTDAEACRAHNERHGLSPDSCRVFIDERGGEHYWSFETTCIMHDDGDDLVRPFQRACRRNIEEYYARQRPSARDGVAGVPADDLYGYEPVVLMSMRRDGDVWSLSVEGVREGVPSPSEQAGGEVTMRVLDGGGRALQTYRLANAGATHRHGDTDAYEVPERGVVRIAVPASAAIERVACEYDRDAHDRTADRSPSRYADAYVFQVGDAVREALARANR